MNFQTQSQAEIKHSFFRGVLGPLSLILFTPWIVFLVWLVNVHFLGSLTLFFDAIVKNGFFETVWTVWKPIFFGNKISWSIFLCFSGFQIALMLLVPGKPFYGPITPMGNVPIYKKNGFSCFLITLATFGIASYGLKLFSPSIVYDHFGALLSTLNIFSLIFCLFLYLKGRYKPSSTDSGLNGNVVLDFYWGTELYPRIGKLDLKQFTNCRFGMMGWPIILLSFAAKQHSVYGLSDSMVVAVVLQLVYVGKFFLWETGYLSSLDIMHDRAGYYICWGCLVWVPGVYTSSTLFLVNHPNHLGMFDALLLSALGITAVMMNYFADRQRQHVRATNGNCLIFGKKPELIYAEYLTKEGEKKSNLLLCSGFWGIARHFHYVPEILAAFFWTLPALFISPLPYFYVVFLMLLLVDRAKRDDLRCQLKYQAFWSDYCKKVPYKMIPKVY